MNNYTLLPVYILLAYIIVSTMEWAAHRYVMHRRSCISKHWKYAEVVFREHAIEHHTKYYKNFFYEKDQRGRNISIALSWKVNTAFALPWMAIVYIISPLFSFAIALLAFAHWFAWNIAHAHMHLRCYLWLDNWEVFRYLEWHHWLHHRYKNKNYNAVFPLADFIFGTSAKPTPQDRQDYAAAISSVSPLS